MAEQGDQASQRPKPGMNSFRQHNSDHAFGAVQHQGHCREFFVARS
jgi:hypothetical protein